MNIETFKRKLINKFREQLQGVAIVSLAKDLSTEITGEVLKIELTNESIINVTSIETLYHLYNSGLNIQGIVELVIGTFCICFKMDTSNIVYRLINIEENNELLKDIPHIPFYDMAIIFSYIVDNCTHTHLIITKELMEQNHLTLSQMTDFAYKNTFIHFPSIYLRLTSSVYMLTCKHRDWGSIAILNTNFLAEIADQWNQNLLLLPGNDTAFALIPRFDGLEKKDITQMVQEALAIEGPLVTRHAFLFNKDTHQLELLD